MGLIYSNIPELEGTDTDIVLSNLRDLEGELSETFEKRLAHLCELAVAILKDGRDPDLVKSIILSIRSDGDLYPDSVLDENERDLKALFSNISLIERLIVFERVFEKINVETPNTSPAFAVKKEAKGRIAYVKNSYNDAVFDYFSTIVDGARAAYYDSPAEVCESVASGKCEFCIVPIETGKDGKMLSFYKAIVSYGLKINAEYDINSNGIISFTRYALLSVNVGHIHPIRRKKSLMGYLEISYSDTESLSIRDILSSAEYFGLKLYSIDTLSLSDMDSIKSYNIVFSSDGADVRMFLTYLSVDCPEYTLIGYYQRD